ncbi:hypothetical protein BKA83DRAFT_4121134 [Pisolithus microcarpus]|nr:hypothetical protein BKA83DRAFT_4121134 [Pisolithus microcarpus]
MHTWDFSNPLMGEWGFSKWSVGDFSMGTTRMEFLHDYYVAVENTQLVIWGFSMDVEIPRMEFLHPSYGGMGNLQFGSQEFPMGKDHLFKAYNKLVSHQPSLWRVFECGHACKLVNICKEVTLSSGPPLLKVYFSPYGDTSGSIKDTDCQRG